MKKCESKKKQAYSDYLSALEYALSLPMNTPQNIWDAARKELLRAEKIYKES